LSEQQLKIATKAVAMTVAAAQPSYLAEKDSTIKKLTARHGLQAPFCFTRQFISSFLQESLPQRIQ
jgi:translation elongation factor EF-Ts